MYKILIKRTALKSMERIPLKFLEPINEMILELGKNPRPKGCKKLVDSVNLYRIRYSNYRIVYTIEDKLLTIEIIKISKRETAYR